MIDERFRENICSHFLFYIFKSILYFENSIVYLLKLYAYTV